VTGVVDSKIAQVSTIADNAHKALNVIPATHVPVAVPGAVLESSKAGLVPPSQQQLDASSKDLDKVQAAELSDKLAVQQEVKNELKAIRDQHIKQLADLRASIVLLMDKASKLQLLLGDRDKLPESERGEIYKQLVVARQDLTKQLGVVTHNVKEFNAKVVRSVLKGAQKISRVEKKHRKSVEKISVTHKAPVMTREKKGTVTITVRGQRQVLKTAAVAPKRKAPKRAVSKRATAPKRKVVKRKSSAKRA
jgi:hypothetical protein